jgi:hypothetical protein
MLEVATRVRFPAQKSRKALPAVMAVKEVFGQQSVDIGYFSLSPPQFSPFFCYLNKLSRDF